MNILFFFIQRWESKKKKLKSTKKMFFDARLNEGDLRHNSFICNGI